jgi:diadenosine tetraphosphate (Ap4A) HIT family hydrolase
MNCPICSWSPSDSNYLLIFETKYWRIVLAPNQCLVGRCIVDLKRHCGDIADINVEELLDWWSITGKVETALRKAFNATMFNWSCYMNLSYCEEQPKPHVHWWAVPRYNHTVIVNELIFEDPDFGKPYDQTRRIDIPKEVRVSIVERIQKVLS